MQVSELHKKRAEHINCMDYENFTNSLVCGCANELKFIDKDTLKRSFSFKQTAKVSAIVTANILQPIVFVGLE